MPDDDDLRLPPLAEFLAELVGAAAESPGEDIENPGATSSFRVSRLRVDLPVELDLRSGGGSGGGEGEESGGGMILEGSPPTQTTWTSVLPVLHRLRLTVVADDGREPQ